MIPTIFTIFCLMTKIYIPIRPNRSTSDANEEDEEEE